MIALLIATLLWIADPVGDAAGDGSLHPPTSGVYAGTASFDLLDVSLLERPNLTLSIVLGALDNPAGLANGFSHPILEIYIDSAEGGQVDLLPGTGMQVPEQHGWETALRLTGDTAEVYHRSALGDLVRMPVEIETVDGHLIVSTPLPSLASAEVTLFGIVGVYDAFSDEGWRSVSREPSPWAFSSDVQRFPVVDVLAPSDEAQRQALRSGVLPLNRAEKPAAGLPWLLMMAVGVLVAVVGIGLRSLVATSRQPPASGQEPAAVPQVATSSASDTAVPSANETAPPERRESSGSSAVLDNRTSFTEAGLELDARAGTESAETAVSADQMATTEQRTTTDPEASSDQATSSDHGVKADREAVAEPAGISEQQALTDLGDQVPTFVVGRAGRGSAPSNTPTVPPPPTSLAAEDGGQPLGPPTRDTAAPLAAAADAPTALQAPASETRSDDGSPAAPEVTKPKTAATPEARTSGGNADTVKAEGAPFDDETWMEEADEDIGTDRHWSSAWGNKEPDRD